MSKKSILEQALLQVQTLEDAVKTNAKGILASTMKKELNVLLKESMEDEDDEEKTPPTPEDTEDDVTGDESGDDTTMGDESDDDLGDESNEEGLDNEEDPELEDGSETNFDSMDTPSDDMGMEDDTLDMTNSSDEEVLKVFKAMKPEDGIVVKKDGDKIQFSDGDNDYIIKLGGEETEDAEFSPEEAPEEGGFEDDGFGGKGLPGLSEQEDVDEDETIYEISLGEDDEELSEEEIEEGEEEVEEGKNWENQLRTPKLTKPDAKPSFPKNKTMGTGNKSSHTPLYKPLKGGKEGDVDESARTIGNGYHAGIESKKKYYAGNKRDEINEEVETLKKQNSEYKKALILFKDKLNEVALFNANLAYATRLMTEHSTTKTEKLNILKRFDSVSTISESKNLYKTITEEMSTKKPVVETVAEKITLTPKTSSTEVLSEQKSYENPQFTRMKELMKNMNK
jgi:hypothetical protein